MTEEIQWPVDLFASLAQNNSLFIFKQQNAPNPHIDVMELGGDATHTHGTSTWTEGFHLILCTGKKSGPSLPLALQTRENRIKGFFTPLGFSWQPRSRRIHCPPCLSFGLLEAQGGFGYLSLKHSPWPGTSLCIPRRLGPAQVPTSLSELKLLSCPKGCGCSHRRIQDSLCAFPWDCSKQQLMHTDSCNQKTQQPSSRKGHWGCRASVLVVISWGLHR